MPRWTVTSAAAAYRSQKNVEGRGGRGRRREGWNMRRRWRFARVVMVMISRRDERWSSGGGGGAPTPLPAALLLASFQPARLVRNINRRRVRVHIGVCFCVK